MSPGDTAGRAALEEVARAMTEAEAEGRVVKRLALADIHMHHLIRDRIALEDEEMEALTASMAARGQQTPIEVLRLPDGKYGLISGLRADGSPAPAEGRQRSGPGPYAGKQPGSVPAPWSRKTRSAPICPSTSGPIIARVAVDQGVYPDIRAAVSGAICPCRPPRNARRSPSSWFSATSWAMSFAFRAAIPEKVGFVLAQALESGSGAGRAACNGPQGVPAERCCGRTPGA